MVGIFFPHDCNTSSLDGVSVSSGERYLKLLLYATYVPGTLKRIQDFRALLGTASDSAIRISEFS